jgi:arabinan endo-1,5-alpha-L-arabinosidase
MVYHAYDAQDNGRSKLRIAPVVWSASGWPRVIA